MRTKTKAKRDVFAQGFPCFMLATCYCPEFDCLHNYFVIGQISRWTSVLVLWHPLENCSNIENLPAN